MEQVQPSPPYLLIERRTSSNNRTASNNPPTSASLRIGPLNVVLVQVDRFRAKKIRRHASLEVLVSSILVRALRGGVIRQLLVYWRKVKRRWARGLWLFRIGTRCCDEGREVDGCGVRGHHVALVNLRASRCTHRPSGPHADHGERRGGRAGTGAVSHSIPANNSDI
ncbi:hypothetical protein CALCODRAFT_338621 [Calocera cornea HHB12733]|uniref:Uncharacterized protein n=1 Tax=Calocera cornea HHB12733 TaxID=1353952 RepID=A0A165EZY1_9BASI|nr:hypothetical protein CALCODRAFT_338621 [Calocera cornea HHB12733]